MNTKVKSKLMAATLLSVGLSIVSQSSVSASEQQNASAETTKNDNQVSVYQSLDNLDDQTCAPVNCGCGTGGTCNGSCG